MSDGYLPPRDTTTALFHFHTPCFGTPVLDRTFTVRGIRSGIALSTWLTQLIAEHGDDTMDSTIEIYTHDSNGGFHSTEVTHCPR